MEARNNNEESCQQPQHIEEDKIDSRELVRKHMQDPNHEFTDEELKKVAVSTDNIDFSEHPIIKALDE